jgi:hypothetical protein
MKNPPKFRKENKGGKGGAAYTTAQGNAGKNKLALRNHTA